MQGLIPERDPRDTHMYAKTTEPWHGVLQKFGGKVCQEIHY